MHPSTRYSVLHGFYGSAGQPAVLANALREQGVPAQNIIVGPNAFGYESDISFPEKGRASFRRVISEQFPAFDVIHIHAITPFFTKPTFPFPMGVDLLAAKAMGKRIVVHFRGSEIRRNEDFERLSPYNYVKENPDGICSRFPASWIDTYLKMCFALADKVCVVDPELQSYAPQATILQRAIDLSKWKYVGPVNSKRPLVVHAPSRSAVKGTPSVLAAVEVLKAEGLDFDFRLIEGLANHEARSIYETSDIIIDQLRIGWYGVLAVEGMALGKAVVSYVRDDLLATFEDREPPVAVANPDTITDVLRKLVLDASHRERQAAAGYDFCKAYHDRVVVARRCADIYEEILAHPRPIDIGAYMEVVAQQEAVAAEALKTALAAELAKKKKKIPASLRVPALANSPHLKSRLPRPVKMVIEKTGQLIWRLKAR